MKVTVVPVKIKKETKPKEKKTEWVVFYGKFDSEEGLLVDNSVYTVKPTSEMIKSDMLEDWEVLQVLEVTE